MKRPPALARLLLLLLPPRVREPISGDLEEEWHAADRPSAARFFLLALRSIVTCWRARLVPAKGETQVPTFTGAGIMQDVRYAGRMVRRAPGFSLAVVLMMTVGIGATTAIFSVVHGVLLRSLPFEDPQRLVRLYTVSSSERRSDLNLSPANYASLDAHARSLEGVAIYSGGESVLTGSGEPRTIAVSRVSAGFFELLRVAPVAGRTFLPEENQPGHRVAMLAEPLTRQLFGHPAAAVGRSVTIDGVARTVVGVLPGSFTFPDEHDAWLPREFDASYSALSAQGRGGGWLPAIARLAEQASLEQARSELAALGATLQREYPASNTGVSFTAVPLHEDVVGSSRGPLLLVFAAVALVLLIVCANVAGLMLARATTRREELAIRRALGAGRGQVVRQLLVEALLLSTIAGVAGVTLASWSTHVLVGFWPESIPRIDEVTVNGAVLAFAIGTTLAVALLVGLLPALKAARTAPGDVLRSGGRTGLSAQRGARARNGLVAAEIALAVVVLTSAGLLLRSVRELGSVDTGFRADAATSFRVSLPPAAYDTDDRVRGFYSGLLGRLEGLGGVESVALTTRLPLSGRLNTTFSFEGDVPAGPGAEQYIEVRSVTAGYFPTMGIPVVEGRGLQRSDHENGMRVGVISASGARAHSGGSVVGRQLRVGTRRQPVTIVGVVEDVRHRGLEDAPAPHLYLPFEQVPSRTAYVVIRSTSNAMSFGASLRSHLAAIDPSLPAPVVRPLDELVDASMARPRFLAMLLGAFAALALALAATGLFALFSFNVSQRTREIGIRMALGADSRGVMRLVIRGALVVAGLGIGTGIVIALVTGRLLESYVFGISTRDPLTFAAVVLLLVGVILVATIIPARRAASVDPLLALRAE